MSRATLTLLALVVAAGCGSKATTPRRVQPVHEADERISLVELRRDLEATVLENYLQLGVGNMEAYADGIGRGQEVTLIGIGPDDVHGGDEDCEAAIRGPARGHGCGRAADRLPFRRGTPCLPGSDMDGPCQGVLSKNLRIRVSRDRRTAWVADELSYRVPHEGRQGAMPLRFTAVFVREVERWVMVMEHISYPLPSELALELASAGALAAPAPLPQQPAPGPLSRALAHLAPDPATHARLLRIREDLREQAGGMAGADSAARDRLIFLPDPRGELRGAEIYGTRTLADAFGTDAQVSAEQVRVHFAPGKRVAWLAANLAVRTTRDARPVSVGLRLTAVLEQDESAAWQLMQAHVSVPLRADQLFQRVFGSGLEPPEAGESARAGGPGAAGGVGAP